MTPPSIDNGLFEKNLSYMKREFPAIVGILNTCDFGGSHLIPVGDSDWDVEFGGGGRLYGCGAKEYSQNHVNGFWAVVDRQCLYMAPPNEAEIDKDGYLREFVNACLEGARRAGVEFQEQRCDKTAVNLVVFGVGLAQHLQRLADESQCESVILIEPIANFFHHSMFVFDWVKFIEEIRARNGNVIISLSSDPTEVASSIMLWLNDRYPSLIDGTMFYRHYPLQVLADMNTEFSTKFACMAGTCFGFFEDELIMVQNNVRNLENFDGYVFKKGAPAINIPAFIVGSGPSFDYSISTIRKQAGNALVISCGTGLQLLLEHGVVPDIHVELERVPAVYDVISSCADKHDFRKTLLVACSNLDPRVRFLFDDSVFFFRKGPCSYPMFNLGEDTVVENAHPMVSNLAMSFAREAGCRQIYLFGVDLGTKDVSQHHGVKSYYTSGKLNYPLENTLRTEGNFGGTVFTHLLYLQSKSIKEEEISRNGRDVEYYNCSDGTNIVGARPLPPTDVRTRPGNRLKKTCREELLRHFSRYERSAFARQWTNVDMPGRVDEFKDRLLSVLNSADNRYDDVIGLMKDLTRVLSAKGSSERNAEEILFRGSLCLAMNIAYFYLTRIASPQGKDVFSNIVRDELMALTLRMHEIIRHTYADLGKA
jgi:hypothetical protein